MKKKLASAVAVCLCLATGLAFAFSLFRYAMPTRDASYSLSIGWEGEALPENWVYDQKGWSVYIQEGGQVTALLADETGFFTGALEPGGVFYYARTLTETLDQPTLRIAEGSFALAVFLDDTLLYADADIGDGRPGSLALPELSVPRRAQQIELPDDYQGKTLTVAQRIADSARPDGLVFAFLTPMTLCSGYAYESGLIAESFRAAIPNTLLLALGLALLALFAVFACRGQWNGPVLCAALALLLWMVNRLSSLSFSPVYVGQRAVDPAFFSRCCSLNVLLLFHAFQARRLRVIPALFAALNTLPTLLCLALALTASSQSTLTVLLYDGLFQFSGFLGLLAIVVCSWLLWRKESRFYRLFAPLATFGLAASAAYALAFHGRDVAQQLFLAVQNRMPAYFLWRLMPVIMLATAISLALDLLGKEISRRVEIRQLARQNAAALESYETLRRQYEQVMMLRHDITKHLQVLRQLTDEPPVASYLDELIGQSQKIPALLQSGNPMLDIILNGKLSIAKDAGVDIRLLRMQAPEKLPLSDAEVCSLIMNLIDNAVRAATNPALRAPFIRLDMHVNDRYFLFTCENSALPDDGQPASPEHGLGLKIARQIMERREANIMQAQQTDQTYKVTLGIYLGEPSVRRSGN